LRRFSWLQFLAVVRAKVLSLNSRHKMHTNFSVASIISCNASCPPGRPVLSNGRCLPTCSKNQFLHKTSSSSQPCDGSCSSCSGSWPTYCLACSQSGQVLKGGSCVAANCGSSTSVIDGLYPNLGSFHLHPALHRPGATLFPFRREEDWNGGRSC
jgi:hypothetical protein